MAFSRGRMPADRWILLSFCLLTFAGASLAFMADVYTGAISDYLQEHPTPLNPPPWVFSPWIWVPIMLNHALVFKLLYGPDRPFEMPRHELLRCFMKEYGDWWTLGFACEVFVVVFINAATTPFSALPEPLASACIAAATAEATFCFVYTSLNKKAYAVMNAMSDAQANGDHPLFGAREFAPNYASMVGLSELVGSIHAAMLCSILPGMLQSALSDPEDPNWVLAWALFFVVLAAGLATTIHGNCIFGLILFYILCWLPLLRTFKKHHAKMGGDGVLALQRVALFFVGKQQELGLHQAHVPICVVVLSSVLAAAVVGVVVVVGVRRRQQDRGDLRGESTAQRARVRMHADSDTDHALDQDAAAAPVEDQEEQQASLTQLLLPPNEEDGHSDGLSRSRARIHDDSDTVHAEMAHDIVLEAHESELLL